MLPASGRTTSRSSSSNSTALSLCTGKVVSATSVLMDAPSGYLSSVLTMQLYSSFSSGKSDCCMAWGFCIASHIMASMKSSAEVMSAA